MQHSPFIRFISDVSLPDRSLDCSTWVWGCFLPFDRSFRGHWDSLQRLETQRFASQGLVLPSSTADI